MKRKLNWKLCFVTLCILPLAIYFKPDDAPNFEWFFFYSISVVSLALAGLILPIQRQEPKKKKPKPAPKYLLCPGWVHSADGDRHYIGRQQLMQLYGVRWEECLVKERTGFPNMKGLIELHPSPNGDYNLPGELYPKRSRINHMEINRKFLETYTNAE